MFKALDLEKRRVDDRLKVVEQVAELKPCVHGVVGSFKIEKLRRGIFCGRVRCLRRL